MATEHFQDKVEHVSGETVAADVFHAADDVGEQPTRFEKEGHETLAHHKHRVEMKNATDKEILTDEGADLPHSTHAGHVDLPGAAPDT